MVEDDLRYHVTGHNSVRQLPTLADAETGAILAARQEFEAEVRAQIENAHRTSLDEELGEVTSPLEALLTRLAEEAEVSRIANILTTEGLSNKEKKKMIEGTPEPQRSYMKDEDGKKYYYQITYTVQGKGEIGAGKQVVPVRYEQRLQPWMHLEEEGNRYGEESDILDIQLQNGKVNTVLVHIPQTVSETEGLLTRSGVEPLLGVRKRLLQANSLRTSFRFDFSKVQPSVGIEHIQDTHVEGGRIPRARYNYVFYPFENRFIGGREGTIARGFYSTDQFTSLLKATHRLIPNRPVSAQIK